jgi:hypothetical protein
LPENYPSELETSLGLDNNAPAADDAVAKRFLGLDLAVGPHRPKFGITLDYQVSAASASSKELWRDKPDWLHAGVSGEVVHWVWRIPTDPSEALERLATSFSWSSPFPHMAVRGDSEFDKTCEMAWNSGTLGDVDELFLANRVDHVLLNAFDFELNILWASSSGSTHSSVPSSP